MLGFCPRMNLNKFLETKEIRNQIRSIILPRLAVRRRATPLAGEKRKVLFKIQAEKGDMSDNDITLEKVHQCVIMSQAIDKTRLLIREFNRRRGFKILKLF